MSVYDLVAVLLEKLKNELQDEFDEHNFWDTING